MFIDIHTAAGINWNAVIMNAGTIFGLVFAAAAVVTMVVKGREI